MCVWGGGRWVGGGVDVGRVGLEWGGGYVDVYCL